LNKQFERFDKMKVNYSKGSWKVDIQITMENGSFKVILDSEQPGYPIRFTTDGSDPTADSPEYKEPLLIAESTVIKAGIFADGKLKEYFTEKEILFHKALGKKGELKEPPSKNYYGNGVLSLTDGLKGSNNFRDGYWIGFEGSDLDFELNFQAEVPISSISVSFYQNTGSWIFLPLKVQFTIYDKDHSQVAIAEKIPETTTEAKGTVIEGISSMFENTKGWFIRVHAVNMKTCPAWHEGTGSKAWIFADEIVVK
jgi:hexosaminidase